MGYHITRPHIIPSFSLLYLSSDHVIELFQITEEPEVDYEEQEQDNNSIDFKD